MSGRGSLNQKESLTPQELFKFGKVKQPTSSNWTRKKKKKNQNWVAGDSAQGQGATEEVRLQCHISPRAWIQGEPPRVDDSHCETQLPAWHFLLIGLPMTPFWGKGHFLSQHSPLYTSMEDWWRMGLVIGKITLVLQVIFIYHLQALW